MSPRREPLRASTPEPPAEPPPPPPAAAQYPPGYWQASDGNWYPPQQSQAPPPPTGFPQQPKKRGGCLKWVGIGVASLIVIIIVAAVAGGGSDDDDTSSGSDGDTEEQDLFPNRPDEKENDHERNLGESAELSGYTATVTGAGFQQQLSDFETNGYLVAQVTLLNRDSEAQSYNTFEWKLITPTGTIIDPYLGGEQLGSGDLAGGGGQIAGQLIWEVGAAPGDYYIVYDPSDPGDDRGVWKVTI